jgi:hypothetical protein
MDQQRCGRLLSKSENVMYNDYHVAAGLKMQEHPREIARNAPFRYRPRIMTLKKNVHALGTSTRTQTLISAAIRVWELKRGIPQTIE